MTKKKNDAEAYMKSVKKFLARKYGAISDEWEAALTMLHDNYQLYVECQRKLHEDGLMVKDRFGNYTKHPLIKVSIDAQIQLIKLMNEFGLTAKSDSKIASAENGEESEFVKNLIRG